MTNPPASLNRRARLRAETVERILAIARTMMQADGVGALSFNAIARRLGMRPPSLYTYFDSKNAIYDELFRRGFEEFARRIDTLSAEGTVAGKIHSAITNYMRFAQENPDLYQLMFQRPVPDFVPSERSMAVSLGALARGEAQLQAAIAQGELHTDLPPAIAQDLLIAMMHGLTELHLANNPALPVGEGRFGALIPHAVQLFLDAWTAGPTDTPKEN